MTFKPIKYVVPGILVEGLTLFAGKPKVGKSWLVLHAALAVARGGFTLGQIHCIEGDVLYCALEDGLRRLQSRMRKLGACEGMKRLTFCYEMPRLSVGGLATIREWIISHPEARLVIIDTLAMVREAKKREETTYDADYQAVLELRKLANEFGLAIVVIHHLRKADSDDAFDTVSGTLGLTGAPDSILILKRDSTGNFVLHGKGRDLVEIEKAATFDREACLWRIEGDAAEVRRSAERTAVLEAMDEAEAPVGPKDIAATTGMRAVNVRKLLAKLVKDGQIEKERYGRYRRKRSKSDDLPYDGPMVAMPPDGMLHETGESKPEKTSADVPQAELKPVYSSADVVPKRRGRRNRMQRWLDHVQAADDAQGELILAMRNDPDMREFESLDEMASYFRGLKAKYYGPIASFENLMATLPGIWQRYQEWLKESLPPQER